MIFCSVRLIRLGEGVWLNMGECRDAGIRIDTIVETNCEATLFETNGFDPVLG